MHAFFLLILAAAVSMLVIPLARMAAPWLGMVDMPDARKVHQVPVPRVGGCGIVIGCLTPLLLLFPLDPLLQSFAIGAATLFVFGLWDDARQIGHWVKFAGQFVAVGIVVYYGDLYVTRLPLLESVSLDPALGRLLTLFAMVGVINAINHSDGLDGLAGGESLLSLIAVGLLGFLLDSALTVGIALAAIGGTIGFLRYNTHPAQVFMGDSGSQVLGFTLGFLVVHLTQLASPSLSPAIALLLLGLPLSDILAVLFLRISGGMNWFKATRNHVHHRLLDLGLNHFETVVVIYGFQLSLVVGAVLLRYHPDWLVLVVYVGAIGALFSAITLAERRGWRLARQQQGIRLLPAAFQGRLAQRLLHTLPQVLIAVALPGFMLFGSLWANDVPRDFGVAAGLLALVLAVELARRRPASSLPARAIVYVAVAFAVYLYVHYPGAAASPIKSYANTLIAALAIAVGLYIKYVSAQSFSTTPTDYLLLFGVVVLASSGELDLSAGRVTQFVAYVIVLFYACEVVIGQIPRLVNLLRYVTLASLLVFAVRGLPQIQ